MKMRALQNFTEHDCNRVRWREALRGDHRPLHQIREAAQRDNVSDRARDPNRLRNCGRMAIILYDLTISGRTHTGNGRVFGDP